MVKNKGFIVGIIVIVALIAAIGTIGHSRRTHSPDGLSETSASASQSADAQAGEEVVVSGSGDADGAAADAAGGTGGTAGAAGASADVGSGAADSTGTGAAGGAGGSGKAGAAGRGTAGNAQGENSESGIEIEVQTRPQKEPVFWNEDDWEFAEESEIHTDNVTLYHADAADSNGITVAVNAGHGCSGGESKQTKCHPDGSAKVTGGSTSAGAVTATAINGGCTLSDGTREADAVLDLAIHVKEVLLEKGFDVLMIRENDDTQLDNIARTVFANNNANCHISLHYDSTDSNKGFFYIGVPEVSSYRDNMYPVSENWERHEALGEAIVEGVQQAGIGIYGSGRMALDLTQTSYSTVPSVDVEVGDKASDHSPARHAELAEGISKGIELYFERHPEDAEPVRVEGAKTAASGDAETQVSGQMESGMETQVSGQAGGDAETE
ncbi:MAG: N-acetylmuramoyl-L-alanine amidase [Eubacterium sp.]|nr:N-acetylmuramoyl-L-alanine amidase [Eubacterium sp.]